MCMVTEHANKCRTDRLAVGRRTPSSLPAVALCTVLGTITQLFAFDGRVRGLAATSYCLVRLTATQVTLSLLANHRYSTFGEFAMSGIDEAGHPVRERLTESIPHVSGNRNVPRASEGLTLRRSPVRFRLGDERGGHVWADPGSAGASPRDRYLGAAFGPGVRLPARRRESLRGGPCARRPGAPGRAAFPYLGTGEPAVPRPRGGTRWPSSPTRPLRGYRARSPVQVHCVCTSVASSFQLPGIRLAGNHQIRLVLASMTRTACGHSVVVKARGDDDDNQPAHPTSTVYLAVRARGRIGAANLASRADPHVGAVVAGQPGDSPQRRPAHLGAHPRRPPTGRWLPPRSTQRRHRRHPLRWTCPSEATGSFRAS
jgi:hypothetical protein